MDSVDLRTETLAALRRWAATDRSTLVAAAWRAGNRNVSELARTAGVGRDAIYADLRAKGIDPTSREEPAATIKAAVLPIPGWRHPHLLAVAEAGLPYGTRYDYTVAPFSGQEPEPELPDEWRGIHPSDGNGPRSWERSAQRHSEIELVRRAWARSHFTFQVGQLLTARQYPYRAPAEDWQAYVEARETLRAAYSALDTTPDNMWRSALLHTVDAQGPARHAAEQWDQRAAAFAKLDHWLLRQLGESEHPTHAIRDAAAEHGIDTSAWLIEDHYDYSEGFTSMMPAAEEIEEIVKKGDERVRRVAALTDAGHRQPNA
ncbi:hypothetical protein GCM10023322_30050 [Rugosimonospora acidiphila]|uniref:Uncharacterized protein n=1 Tax=Rugosimonospora acidiphila TaxID=556531 RepID=A0ABP9RTL0_9ACTN